MNTKQSRRKFIANKVISVFYVFCMALPLFSQEHSRGKIAIPDLKGYITLKCDFHIHTVFSDGAVWPTERIDEAYYEGIDAIAITDNIETGNRYQLTNQLKVDSRNIAHDIAAAHAKNKGIILIRGGEITRDMPPGHSNAIFLSNVDELVKPDYMDAYRAAKSQNAFIIWNHPGWVCHQPDTTLWWPVHTQLLEQGMMHGIEVANGGTREYSPEAHRWCLEKKLTMIGSTDAHAPMQKQIDFASMKHRTMTLVFVRDATPEDIYDALKERRTAIYHEKYVIGEEKYLKELFENALEWKVTKGATWCSNEILITFNNKSDLTFYLKPASHDPKIVYLRNMVGLFTIEPKSEQTLKVYLLDDIKGGDVNLIVENFLVQPNTGMKYTVKIEN